MAIQAMGLRLWTKPEEGAGVAATRAFSLAFSLVFPAYGAICSY